MLSRPLFFFERGRRESAVGGHAEGGLSQVEGAPQAPPEHERRWEGFFAADLCLRDSR
jgi:hypothetical protein